MSIPNRSKCGDRLTKCEVPKRPLSAAVYRCTFGKELPESAMNVVLS